MKLIYLTQQFYNDYACCPEILQKPNRPYACLTVKIENHLFAIPLRHHISHSFCFNTTYDYGLDYTKAVVVDDNNYIAQSKVWINSTEWNVIKANEPKIIYEFTKYVRQYKRASRNPNNPRNMSILRYSALQYFNL
ncbi:MAG: hypothetical protein J5504_08370 [Butyrivibrio sp.]|nr:hypothetical protein [Butyrivibrio sp.]